MKFSFRSATGRLCCEADNREHLCNACKAIAAASPRAAGDYVPPDPYAADVKRLQQAIPFAPSWPAPPTEMRTSATPCHPGPHILNASAYAPPDSYRAALDKMKESRS